MLVTAQFPELREKSNSRILVGAARLEAASCNGHTNAQLSHLRAGLTKAYAARSELELLASTHSQREAYGLANWNAQFVRLLQIEPPAGCKLTRQQLRTALWRAVPACKFKRFQEAFCDPHNFIVPRFELSQDGKVVFDRTVDFKDLSVAACLVSADRIPDDLALSLGILPPEARSTKSPLSRLKIKCTVDAINHLKSIWDSASSLSERDFRVLVVSSNKKNTNDDNNGTILYTREDVTGRVQRRAPLGGPAWVNPARAQHFTNSFGAYRKTLHAKTSYDSESQTLSKLLSSIQTLLHRLSNEWKKSTPKAVKEEIGGEIRDAIAATINTLARCSERNKTWARSRLLLVQDLRDSLGRVNPGVTGSRVAHALKALERRVKQAVDKIGYNERDRALIRDRILKDAEALSSVRKALLTQSERVLRQSPLFSKKRLSEQAIDLEVSGVKALLLPTLTQLNGVQMRPLATFAKAVAHQSIGLEAALRSRSTTTTKEAMVKIFILTKLSATQVVLERIKEKLTGTEIVPIGTISKLVEDLESALAARVFPAMRVDRHELVFEELLTGVADIRALLDRHSSDWHKCSPKSTPVKELKKLADSINPERLALKLAEQSSGD